MLDKDLIYLTFDQWKRLNYNVNKGEKSSCRNHSCIALFSERQVSFEEYSDDYEDYIYEDAPNM